jgi:ubiquinone/menaquinone biosynthesis C-methylase UbiE
MNQYTQMQKSFYKTGTSNHLEHNKNKDYWDILLKDLKDSDFWTGKVALDFGSGMGRNVTNMLNLCDWSRVDGVDISEGNIAMCKEVYTTQPSEWYCNNGVDLEDLKSDEYDFIMSTVVLQHIPVHEIRTKLLKEMHRVLKKDGILSIQMAFGPEDGAKALYFDNKYDAVGTNSMFDVRVTSEEDVKKDFESMGFTNVTCEVTDSFSDGQHPQWIFIRAEK